MSGLLTWIYSGVGGVKFMKHFKCGASYKSLEICSSPYVQTGYEAYPGSHIMRSWGSFPCCQRVALTTHPHLVLRWRMSRSYTSPSWQSRTALLYFYCREDTEEQFSVIILNRTSRVLQCLWRKSFLCASSVENDAGCEFCQVMALIFLFHYLPGFGFMVGFPVFLFARINKIHKLFFSLLLTPVLNVCITTSTKSFSCDVSQLDCSGVLHY
jgi:hypothetical protein